MKFSRFNAWVKYAQTYGYANATVYALYKLFPAKFSLTEQILKRNPAAGAASVSYFQSVTQDVCHFESWEQMGGASDPASSEATARCFVWFVPDWSNVWGGGHYTLFRFANYFASKKIRNIIYVYNNNRHPNAIALQRDLESAFSPCLIEVIVDPKLLPSCYAAISTTWQSAYSVRSFPFAERKFYFMQDYESLFYASGTAAMQANATYGFGFAGITGGSWLRHKYELHGGSAISYRFAADKNIFYPADKNGKVREKVRKLFFYGRPSTERRCFELGIAALRMISARYPDVEIVIAGLDLKSKPDFPATLLGNMSLEDTGTLYRSCDVGIAFSGTNLSYLPVELMATGVPVLSNCGPHVEWHCQNLANCLLVEAVPEVVMSGFVRLYEDIILRQKIADGGLATMAVLNWDNEMEKVLTFVSSEVANN